MKTVAFFFKGQGFEIYHVESNIAAVIMAQLDNESDYITFDDSRDDGVITQVFFNKKAISKITFRDEETYVSRTSL